MNQYSQYDHIFDPTLVFGQKEGLVYFNNISPVFFKLSPRLLKQKKTLNELCSFEGFDLEQWIAEAFKAHDVLISPEVRMHLLADPDNDYHVIMKAIPLDKFVAIHFHDMTVEKNLHSKYRLQLEELKKTHNQILQADKLSTLGELTANISHEINNPLTIAAGHSEIISDYLNSSDPMAKLDKLKVANETIWESLDRVNLIIKNMKDFLHQSEDKKEYCDLESIVESAIEWTLPTAKKIGVNLNWTKLPENLVVLGNKLKLEQVIINLIKNSIDAIEDSNIKNGEISISVTKSENDQQIKLNVVDNGPGIPEDLKPNMFTPFISTKDEGRGSGLGLSICAKIMESHQGKIEHIETKQGCHFQIGLPCIETYSYTRNDKSLTGSAKHQRILVLGPEAQILNVMNSFIQEDDMVFIGSSDPVDALDFLNKASVDLIITDLSLPHMSGRDFARKAREDGHSAPILYMATSKNVEHFNRDKKDIGINGLILRPLNKVDVMKTIYLALSDNKGGKPWV